MHSGSTSAPRALRFLAWSDAWLWEKLAVVRAIVLLLAALALAVFWWDLEHAHRFLGETFLAGPAFVANAFVGCIEALVMLLRADRPRLRARSDPRTGGQLAAASVLRLACALAPLVAFVALAGGRLSDSSYLARHEGAFRDAVEGRGRGPSRSGHVLRDGPRTVVVAGGVGTDTLYFIHDPTHAVVEREFEHELALWDQDRSAIRPVTEDWYAWERSTP